MPNDEDVEMELAKLRAKHTKNKTNRTIETRSTKKSAVSKNNNPQTNSPNYSQTHSVTNQLQTYSSHTPASHLSTPLNNSPDSHISQPCFVSPQSNTPIYTQANTNSPIMQPTK